MNITELAQRAHQNSRNHGFWAVPTAIEQLPREAYSLWHFTRLSSKVDLIHTEAAEATEELRKKEFDQLAFLEELADVVIRAADLAAYVQDGTGATFEKIIQKKLATNDSRPHLHGKRF